MIDNKRITVLMSVYNGEKYLREAIDSILNQTYKDFDFVIYDDCSTDSSASIINSYEDPRIIYRYNEVNQGLTRNLADGVERAETEYIARMDADDIAYPERLQKQIAWMDEHRDVSILGTPVSYFYDMPGDGELAQQPTDDATIKATLFVSFTLMHPSIMIRRADLVEHELNYNPEYRCSQDHALYLDCIRSGLKFANMQVPLLYMRSHGESISKAKHGAQQECSQRARWNFLKATGIASDCTKEEIDAYNTFASGYFPILPSTVHLIESFMEKIYSNPNLNKYFDNELIRHMIANKLSYGAYHAIEDKITYRAALEARKSQLMQYSDVWPLKMKVKFIIKRLINWI